MGDEDQSGHDAELEDLRQKLNDSERRFTAAEEKLNDSHNLLANALAALAAGGRAAAAPPSAEDTRRDRMTKLYTLLQKSQKIKDYKESSEELFRKWFDKYQTELFNLGNISCNLDLTNHPLSREEYLNCLQLKLDYNARKRLEDAFLTHDPLVTWDTITIDQVNALMVSEFGVKVPDIAAVLSCFGPERFKRSKDMSVSQYYHMFREKLPECLKPNTNEAYRSAIDTVHKSIFYQGIGDPYIEQQLCNLKGDNLTIKDYFNEAVAAEARKRTFEKTGDRCNELTPSAISSINKFEHTTPGNRGSWRGRSGIVRGRGRGTLPTCWICSEVGHTQYKCPKQKSKQQQKSYQQQKNYQQHSAKQMELDQIEAEEYDSKKITVELPIPVDYPQYKTDIIPVTSGLNVHGTSTGSNVAVIVAKNDKPVTCNSVRAAASRDAAFTITTAVSDINATTTVLPSTENIMAGIIFNDIYGAELEVDTAASHNVMSNDMFKALVKRSGNKPPILEKSNAILRLADGTPSDKLLGCAHISVKLAKKDSEPTVSAVVPMFVVNGPNCLLGRPAIQCIMPKLYKSLSNVARDSIEALHRSPVAGGRAATAHDTCVATTTTARAADVARVMDHDVIAHAMSATPEDPPRRMLPPPPTGDVTQEEGERYCKLICDTYPEVFNEGRGCFKGTEARMHVKEGHMDALYQVGLRPCAKVPYGIQDEMEEKWDEFYETHTPVDGRDLFVASQVVPVVSNKEGKARKIRLCSNYKNTINEHLLDEPHVYSTCNEQLDKLRGEYRSTIDLHGAFNQIPVPEGFSQQVLAVVTPRGFAVPTRMPFGVKTAPGIWTSNMNKLIHGMGGKSPLKSTACIVDDICVTGATPQEHFENLHNLIYRLYAAGLKANKYKCSLYQNEVKFLGKIIDRDGIRLDPATTSAIINMPTPSNKDKLRSFLGHMSYIGRFVPDVRLARAPLDALMKADTKFVWTADQDKAFNMCKKLASNAATLAHFDPSLPLVLTTDASPVGLGACLSHRVTENGKSFLKPLSYASCSLKPAELNYAQVDREGLSVYWAMKHYRQYLYCKKFELHTDCSALLKIFGPKNDLGGCATGRLNRWAAQLMEYDFTVIHIKGVSNKTCDSLSRLPVPPAGELQVPCPTGVRRPVSVTSLASDLLVKNVEAQHMFNEDEIVQTVACLAQLPDPGVSAVSICTVVGTAPSAAWDVLPLTIKDVAKATLTDGIYGKLLAAVRSGDLRKDDPELKPFVSVFNDLYVEQDVIFHGSRIVIPTKQQQRLLQELHQTHFGIVKMKEVARKYFWWPKITKEIEEIVQSCNGCRKYRKKPAPAPLCPWPYSRRPMERVHIDYCEYRGKMLLIMVDSYSKFYWCHIMNYDTTAKKSLAVLFGWFCERGFPTTLVSDNGPQFTSGEFADKMKKWGIKHLLTPPYHPQSNGLAERAVGTIKSHLKKMNCPVTPLEFYVNIQRILHFHNATPQASTDQNPFELMAKAPVPSLFPQLQLSQNRTQEENRAIVPKNGVKGFQPGDVVLVYNNHTKLNSQGTVKDVKSNNSYIVFVDGIDRHISGDNMSLIKDSDGGNNFANNLLPNENDLNTVLPDQNINNSDYEDNISINSEDSDIYIHPTRTVLYNAPKRHYRSEAQKLRDGLSQNNNLSRLRSGRHR